MIFILNLFYLFSKSFFLFIHKIITYYFYYQKYFVTDNKILLHNSIT
jgi:hypothetical protein